MKKGVLHLNIEQGTTFDVVVDLERGGVAWDMTGYTHSAKIYQGDTAITTVTVTAIDASIGQFRFSVSATNTALLKAGSKYSWAYYATTGTTVYSVLGGDVIVTTGMP